MNKIILIGRLGKDAETKELNSERSAVSFTVATSESYKNKDGEWIEQTEWHNVQMYGSTNISKFAAVLKKGLLVSVEGKITTVKTDDGKYFTKVIAREVKPLESTREKTEQKPKPEPDNSAEGLDFDESDQEVPF